MSTTSVTVRINDDLLSRLKSRADAENRTLSNMINSILSNSFHSQAIQLDDIERSLWEPVRCKDCRFRGDINLCPLAYIEKTEQFTALYTDEWFCGNGKRR